MHRRHDVGEFLRIVAARLRADENLAGGGSHRSAREVEGGLAHRRGDLVEGEPILEEPLFRDLDRDFEVANPGYLDLGVLEAT